MAERETGMRNERAAIAAALLCVALAGCATTPDTDLAWPVVTYHTVTVRAGDTLSEIADRNNVAESTLVSLNDITNRNSIYPGQVLRVPAVSRAPERVAVTPTRKPAEKSASTIVPRPKPATPDWRFDFFKPTPRPELAVATTGSGEFAWPVEGQIISKFGSTSTGERNDGINISATLGEPIHAAASGTVTYAGNELKGYGNLVLIRHDDGYVTAYAHAESITVARGDRVAKGQVIGYAGATGDVRSPQLHFEIRKGVEPVDPKPLLMAASY